MARRVVLSAVLLSLTIASGVARAQAIRTWVSGVGDDANPCSRTAPCKTFAGAISKTAAGGEIDALDPGGFGGVTIGKSLTIDGGPGVAGIVFSLTTAIIVNAASGDVVTLRNLSLNGGGNGLRGINFIAGKTLHVENVTIQNSGADPSAMGIDFHPASGTSRLFVSGTTIKKMQGGIKVAPTGAAAAVATIENSLLNGNATFGLRVEGNASVVANNVTADGNLNGFFVTDTSGALPVLSLESCVAAHNSNGGVRAGFGLAGLAKLILSNTQVFENANGLQHDANGQIQSFGNNKVFGNGIDGTPSFTIPQS